jgi:serine/threonine protein kinase
MNPLTNPYQFSNPVYRETEFFDRKWAIDRLCQAIYGRRSIQLAGQYRIGKSSLLKYIHTNLAKLIDDEQAIAIYYDLSRRPRLRDGNDFFARIWRLMSHALVESGRQDATLPARQDLTDPFEFDDFLDRWVEKEGYQFVLLLDEFGFIARNKDFDMDFLDNIRSTIPTLTYILGTPRSLSDFAHEQVITSPLWNKLQLIQLTLFEKQEFIRELIHKPVERIGMLWPKEAENFIYERGGQYPCYIQMAASTLYETQDEWQMNYKQAEKIFRDTATDHFRHLWTKTLYDPYRPEREALLRTALIDLIHGRRIDDDLARDLESRSLVWPNESTGQWELFSVWFADWLRRWSTDKRIKAETKSKQLLEAGKDKDLQSSWRDLDLKKGHLLGKVYRVERVISRTNHSQIIVAYDERLKRNVVIKCPRLEQETDDDVQRLKENLIREASIVANLDHPNIGKVYHALLEPLGVVMKWINGLSFQDILDKGETKTTKEIIQIAIKLAGALSYIHSQGIVHRDIKPGNIILTDDGNPILIDFDIARSNTLETITRLDDGSYGQVGTSKYSAPEQFLNPEGVDSSTDLFALGLVLYQLLTDKLPYEYGNLPSLYEGGFPKPESHNIPGPLYQILCSLLHQQPDQRPTAAEFREQLSSLQLSDLS